MQNFKIAFFSSSDFCIPIVQNILQNQGRTLLYIYSEQVIALRTKSEYSTVFPLDFDITNFPELDLPTELSLIVSQPDSNNRGKIIPNPVTKWARENNLNIFIPESFNKSRSELMSEIDLAITASFGQIISEDSLSWPKNGFVNWHPSLLPLYRGATPMQSAIKNGDKESGLSWINMTKGLDEGDVFLQFNTTIEKDNFASLSQRLGELGSRTWAIAIVNKLIGKHLEQDETKITFCGKLAKEDRIINPINQTALEIYNQFRAYSTFPGTSFVNEYFGEEIKLVECNTTTFLKIDLDEDLDFAKTTLNNWLVTKSNKTQIAYLICKDQTLLEVTKIKLATGKDQTLSGYQFKTK
jgi:methionyl-tRNA formyltransferase